MGTVMAAMEIRRCRAFVMWPEVWHVSDDGQDPGHHDHGLNDGHG